MLSRQQLGIVVVDSERIAGHGYSHGWVQGERLPRRVRFPAALFPSRCVLPDSYSRILKGFLLVHAAGLGNPGRDVVLALRCFSIMKKNNAVHIRVSSVELAVLKKSAAGAGGFLFGAGSGGGGGWR